MRKTSKSIEPPSLSFQPTVQIDQSYLMSGWRRHRGSVQMLAGQHQPRHHQHRHHPEQGGAAGRHQRRARAGHSAQPGRGDGDDNQKFTMKHVITNYGGDFYCIRR